MRRVSARARVYEYRVPSNGFTAAAVSRACAPLQVTSDWFPRRVIYYYYSIFRFPLYIIRTGIIVQYYYYSVSSFTTTTVAAADAATAETVILAVVRTRSSTCPRSGGVRYSHSAAPAYAATTVTIHSQRADNPPTSVYGRHAHTRCRAATVREVEGLRAAGNGSDDSRSQFKFLRRSVRQTTRPSDPTTAAEPISRTYRLVIRCITITIILYCYYCFLIFNFLRQTFV